MRSKRLKRMGFCIVGLLIVFCALAGWHRYASDSAEADVQQRILKIANQLRAPGDQNTMTVATSQSDMAQHMRYEIQQELIAHMTDGEVMEDMVREYGAGAYAAPPLRGFGMVVWLLPVSFLAALVVLFVVVLRRNNRHMRKSILVDGVLSAKNRCDGVADRDALREYL